MDLKLRHLTKLSRHCVVSTLVDVSGTATNILAPDSRKVVSIFLIFLSQETKAHMKPRTRPLKEETQLLKHSSTVGKHATVDENLYDCPTPQAKMVLIRQTIGIDSLVLTGSTGRDPKLRCSFEIQVGAIVDLPVPIFIGHKFIVAHTRTRSYAWQSPRHK